MNSSKRSIQNQSFSISLVCFALLDSTSQAVGLATTQNVSDGAWIWDLVIAAIVLVFTLASGALSLAAMRQWRGKWSISALLPMVILALWCLIIVIAKVQSPESHTLWPFEIFAWAMLNMVYMVGVMTIKRILEKEIS